MKSVADLMKAFGGYRELAAALGKPEQTVAAWKYRGVIPAVHFPVIVEKAKERRIKGVSLQSLYTMNGAIA